MDIQDLLDMVIASQSKRSNLQGRVYTDEPIVMRGSQMASYVPPRIAQMRELERTPEARTKPGAWLFYQQAKLMEDYEDDAPSKASFWQYFPTYSAMNNRQLRAYFSWRTDVRHERESKQPASLSYAFVHLYELLCGVGVTLEPIGRPREGLTLAEQGFYAIEHFWHTYEGAYPELGRYARRWLRDYAVYHNLNKELLAPYVDETFVQAIADFQEGMRTWDASMASLPRVKKNEVNVAAGATNPGEESLFRSLDTLSSYRPRVSRLYRDRPETFSHVCCAVVADLAHHYEKRRKLGLIESLFGDWYDMPVTMFMNAVFWDENTHEDCTYELSPHNLFVCKNGYWVHCTFHGTTEKSPELGRVLRVCDQRLREAIGYKHKLVAKDAPKYLDKFIATRIAERLAWEEEQERRTIHVDLSQLAGIRAAASTTRESLLLDEEREEEPPNPSEPSGSAETLEVPATGDQASLDFGEGAGAPRAQASWAGGRIEAEASVAAVVAPGTAGYEAGAHAMAIQEQASAGAADETIPSAAASQAQDASGPAAGPVPFGLTQEELVLLEALLEHREPQVQGSLDMLVDSVNEKLFDLLGDTALEFDLMSATPSIIEDYEQDVREAIAHE